MRHIAIHLSPEAAAQSGRVVPNHVSRMMDYDFRLLRSVGVRTALIWVNNRQNGRPTDVLLYIPEQSRCGVRLFYINLR